MAARLLHAPQQSRRQGSSQTASSLLLSWSAVTCKQEKKRTQQLILLLFLSRSVLGFLKSVLLSFSLPFRSVSTADLLYRQSMALGSGNLWSDYREAGAWLAVGGFCWICCVWAAAGGEGNVGRWLCWLKEMKRVLAAAIRPPLGPNGGETVGLRRRGARHCWRWKESVRDP